MATFDAQIRQFAEKAGENVDQVIRGTLLSIFTAVIKRTPVGDPNLWVYNRGTSEEPDYVDYIAYQGYPPGYIGGTARGNWQAQIGAQPTSILDRQDENGQVTIAAAQPAIDDAPGEVLWITNNVPYIERLEFEGWSTQAPSGMVRVTMSEFNREVEQQAARVNR